LLGVASDELDVRHSRRGSPARLSSVGRARERARLCELGWARCLANRAYEAERVRACGQKATSADSTVPLCREREREREHEGKGTAADRWSPPVSDAGARARGLAEPCCAGWAALAFSFSWIF
jgi:hypothetical protein